MEQLSRIVERETGEVHTGSGPISISFQRKQIYKLAEVRLTLGAVSTDLDDFSVSVDSELGAAFDHVLAAPDSNEDLSVVQNFRYADPVPPVIFPGDAVVITWPNADEVVWAVEIIAQG